MRSKGCVEVQKKEWKGRPGRSQSFRYQCRQVNDYSPGRRGVVQDGGTRDGTCHGKIDPSRKSQDWTTACRYMSKRGGRANERISRSKRARAGLLAM